MKATAETGLLELSRKLFPRKRRELLKFGRPALHAGRNEGSGLERGWRRGVGADHRRPEAAAEVTGAGRQGAGGISRRENHTTAKDVKSRASADFWAC